MALGGGSFTTQDKKLPGIYMNFISSASASTLLSDRGIAAMAFELDWGVDGEIFEITSKEFKRDALKIFGYDSKHEKLKNIRELFLNINKLYAYKLNSAGVKASNDYCEAKYSGIRGNDLKIIVAVNVDNADKYDVSTLLDSVVVDTQTVTDASVLVDNDFVVFKKNASLSVTASMPLTGGTNGSAVTGTDYQKFFDKVQSFSFNVLGVASVAEAVNGLAVSFTKRMRDEMGVKFQTVLYNTPANYEGIINVKNKVIDASANEASLVYWVTGACAGCEINKSNLNKIYDGEYEIDVDYTQTQLENAIEEGSFTLHRVGADIRVLSDINSLTAVTSGKSEVFKENQTIRVIDQIGNDIAVIFNTKYLGSVLNNAAGRVSLWTDIVKYMQELQMIRAIEEFSDENIKVDIGDTKKSVVIDCAITVANAMSQLYMTTVIS